MLVLLPAATRCGDLRRRRLARMRLGVSDLRRRRHPYAEFTASILTGQRQQIRAPL